MKKYQILVVAGILAGFVVVCAAQTDKMIADLSSRIDRSLVIVHCVFEDDNATPPVVGQAICVHKSGRFVTLAFGAGMINAKVKKCSIYVPGQSDKPLQAELMSIDRSTGIAFIRCVDKSAGKWNPVKFASRSSLSVGQKVVSVGLMPGDPANTPYFGSACISSILRAPEKLVYVTSGTLTRIGSPVFNTAGQVIGMVQRQLPQTFEMAAARGRRANVALQGRRQCSFFTPVEEFVYVLKSSGKTRRPPAWTGIIRFQAVDKEILNIKHPAVRIGKIIPAQPAAKAGLKDLDVIVKVDGQYLEKLATPELTAMNLERKLLRLDVGSKVVFTLANNKKVTVTLEAMPTRPSEARRYANGKMGMLIREKVMLDEYLSTSPAMKIAGLLVYGVVKNGPANRGDLRRGDVITSVSAQPVQSIATFKQIIKKAQADNQTTLNLLVRRGDKTESISILLPK